MLVGSVWKWTNTRASLTAVQLARVLNICTKNAVCDWCEKHLHSKFSWCNLSNSLSISPNSCHNRSFLADGLTFSTLRLRTCRDLDCLVAFFPEDVDIVKHLVENTTIKQKNWRSHDQVDCLRAMFMSWITRAHEWCFCRRSATGRQLLKNERPGLLALPERMVRELHSVYWFSGCGAFCTVWIYSTASSELMCCEFNKDGSMVAAGLSNGQIQVLL